MAKASGTANSDWKQQLHQLLPLYGHRNWIVVADSAYPAQSRAGIDTIVSGASQIEVARRVSDAIAASKHVRADIYLDQELQFVAEADAPGVSRYRTQLAKLLKIAKTITLPHEQIIASSTRPRSSFACSSSRPGSRFLTPQSFSNLIVVIGASRRSNGYGERWLRQQRSSERNRTLRNCASLAGPDAKHRGRAHRLKGT